MCGRKWLRIPGVGGRGKPVSFCPALARILGRMTQEVNIMFALEADGGPAETSLPERLSFVFRVARTTSRVGAKVASPTGSVD